MASYVLTFVLLFLFCQTCQSAGLSCYAKRKIKSAINYFLGEGNCRTILFRDWPCSRQENVDVEHYTTPGIMIWDVLRSHGTAVGSLKCPFCDQEKKTSCLRNSGLWSDGSSNCRYHEPRILYDTSCSILLVSAVYTCPQNHQVPSHHPSILSRLPSSCYNSFYLTNRAGFTIEFLSQITALVDHGTSFHSIEGIVREQYEQVYWRMRLRFDQDCLRGIQSIGAFPPFSQVNFPYPHEKIIRNVFISYSMLFLRTFHADMGRRTSLWISCDHTFKSAANIGFSRLSDSSWVRLFRSIFCVMGGNGEVLHWRFTRGESFEEVSEIFTDLKKRFDAQDVKMEGIIIDNCCKWSGMFSSIFPGVPVKLDLFHAVQRFLSVLPISIRKQSGISKEYGMIFRQPCDLGESREKHTPDAQTITKNLESFLRKWSSMKQKGELVLNSNAIKAIENLKCHIVKGCLSYIPPHCSTSRNERLHRELNYILHSNKLGLDLAYMRCTRLFFKNNNKYRSSFASEFSCPDNPSSLADTGDADGQSFGVERGVSFENGQSAVLGLDSSGIIKSLQQLKAGDIYKIRNIISGSIGSCSQSISSDEEHGYSSCDVQMNETALCIALDALHFYEIYKSLDDLGYGRFLSKSKLPNSIGLGNIPFRQLNTISSNSPEFGDADFIDSVLAGHLEAFGLQHVTVAGDGNCFFSAVGFQISSLLSSHDTPRIVVDHLNNIGIVQSMTLTEIAQVLRMLVVNEWRGNRADEYRNFLQAEFDYHQETINYEESGYFGGALGDLMPIAMSNVLRMPLVIVTAEPHTPLISVCPGEPVLYSSSLFLVYNSLGVGHYDVAIPSHGHTLNKEEQLTAQEPNKEQCNKDVGSTKHSESTTCRCGEGRANNKVFKRRYVAQNRCRCMAQHNRCSRACKCAGRCGGKICKKVVFSKKQKMQASKKKARHPLQANQKKLTNSNVDQNGGFQFNFLEICVLSAIIQQMRSIDGDAFAWNVDRIKHIYLLVISNLLTLGIVLPLNDWSRKKIEKEMRKLKKLFSDD